MRLTPITSADLEQILEWIAKDPFHVGDPRCQAEGLLTGNGVLTFCLQDDQGPLCFVRLDVEGEALRLSTQFGPEEEVNKRRLVTGLLDAGIPAIILFGKNRNYKGIVFESINPSLIAFMSKQGFKATSGNDYMLTFGE
jgi:hypothetical protein